MVTNKIVYQKKNQEKDVREAEVHYFYDRQVSHVNIYLVDLAAHLVNRTRSGVSSCYLKLFKRPASQKVIALGLYF